VGFVAGRGWVGLRHRRVVLLVVDHGLQGGVDGEVEGLAFDLRGAGQVGWRAGWAEQGAQVQRVSSHLLAVQLQSWLGVRVGWGQQHIAHVQLELAGQVAVGWHGQAQLRHLLGAQLERLVPGSGVQVEHHWLGAGWAVELDEPRLVAMRWLLLGVHHLMGLAIGRG